eukprot:CAMPEP_0181470304 /NCGR_PEP_ID=MMETSP1110-20121109/38479_1 /TAXON_ID=174948 /ORGANISM="Symbiodinium sp., Strain CCMP421" /LENGTH=68 /DNA_ID=CAMNT_0023595265 /DNA_START=62 /DNA_END=268 /DNA_ORIENTATION=-
MVDRQTQDYVESLLVELGEDATLEDLIRRIGDKQRERILKAAQGEAQRLQAVVDTRVQERRSSDRLTG